MLLLAPGTPRAQDAEPAPDEEARSLFQSGTEHFAAADYELALSEYSRAFELSGRVELTYNIYLCHERLGHLAEAVHWLRRYLAESLEVHRREVLVRRLATMRRRLEEAGAQTDRPEEEDPPATELSAPGGGHEVEPASSQSGPSDDPFPAPESGPEVAAPDFEMPVGAVVSFSVAGAGALGLALFGGLALAEDDRLRDVCAGACEESRTGSLRGLMIAADTSLAFSVAGLLAGTVWVLVALATGG